MRNDSVNILYADWLRNKMTIPLIIRNHYKKYDLHFSFSLFSRWEIRKAGRALLFITRNDGEAALLCSIIYKSFENILWTCIFNEPNVVRVKSSPVRDI